MTSGSGGRGIRIGGFSLLIVFPAFSVRLSRKINASRDDFSVTEGKSTTKRKVAKTQGRREVRKGNERCRNTHHAENEEETPKTVRNAKIFASLHLCAFALIRLRLRCARVIRIILNSAVDRLSTEKPTAPQHPIGLAKTLRNKQLGPQPRFLG
jgi:hypothetical protein